MEEQKQSLEDRIKHADQIIEYYRLFLTSGHSFRLGLYMARQWRKYLVEEQHDLDELRMFANALEGGADMHGSGWHDLTLGVKRWLAELEEGGETL